MPHVLRQRLRQSLIARYAYLRQRLERIVGSHEDAADALQETWVQLEGVGDHVSVHSDDGYLLGMAVNIAMDSYHRRRALLTASDLDSLIGLADEGADTARQALARIELEELIELLQSMPARQRTVLLAVRVQGLTYAQIAAQTGLSVAVVHKEMNRAISTLRRRRAAQSAAPVRHTAGSQR